MKLGEVLSQNPLPLRRIQMSVCIAGAAICGYLMATDPWMVFCLPFLMLFADGLLLARDAKS